MYYAQRVHMRQSDGPLRLTSCFRALLSTAVSPCSLCAQPPECIRLFSCTSNVGL